MVASHSCMSSQSPLRLRAWEASPTRAPRCPYRASRDLMRRSQGPTGTIYLRPLLGRSSSPSAMTNSDQWLREGRSGSTEAAARSSEGVARDLINFSCAQALTWKLSTQFVALLLELLHQIPQACQLLREIGGNRRWRALGRVVSFVFRNTVGHWAWVCQSLWPWMYGKITCVWHHLLPTQRLPRATSLDFCSYYPVKFAQIFHLPNSSATRRSCNRFDGTHVNRDWNVHTVYDGPDV